MAKEASSSRADAIGQLDDEDVSKSRASHESPMVKGLEGAVGNQCLAHLACLGVQTLFSGWNIIGSLALNYHGSNNHSSGPSPLAFTLVRQVGAAGVLWAIAVASSSQIMPRRQDNLRVIMYGLAGGCGMPVFFLYGLQLTTPTVCAIYDGPLMPIVVSFLTLVSGVERLLPSLTGRLTQLGSIVLAVAGAVVIVLHSGAEAGSIDSRRRVSTLESVGADSGSFDGDLFSGQRFSSAATAAVAASVSSSRDNTSGSSGDSNTGSSTGGSAGRYLLGNACLVLECVCMALLLVLQKPLLAPGRYSPLLTSLWMYAVGAAGNAVLMSVVEDGGVPGATGQMWSACHASTTVLYALLYLVLAEGVVAYLLLSYANKCLPSSTVALYACVQPVLTGVIAQATGQEQVTLVQAAGAVAVMAGLVLNVRAKKVGERETQQQQARDRAAVEAEAAEIEQEWATAAEAMDSDADSAAHASHPHQRHHLHMSRTHSLHSHYVGREKELELQSVGLLSS